MENQKPWPGVWRKQDFAEGRGLTPQDKMSESTEALSKLMQLKRITDGGLMGDPSRWKSSYFNAIKSHFAVLRPFEKPKVLAFTSQLKNKVVQSSFYLQFKFKTL